MAVNFRCYLPNCGSGGDFSFKLDRHQRHNLAEKEKGSRRTSSLQRAFFFSYVSPTFIGTYLGGALWFEAVQHQAWYNPWFFRKSLESFTSISERGR